MEATTLRCLVLGDGNVGKTSLIITCITNMFPADFVPGVCHAENIQVIFNHSTVSLMMCDIADHAGYRPLSYPPADVILLCFSLTCPYSYQSICNLWFPEVRRHCPGTPIILVGTKMDLLYDCETTKELNEQMIAPIATAQGLQMGKEIKAKYMECSSLTQDGLKELMEEAICEGLQYTRSRLKNVEDQCTLI